MSTFIQLNRLNSDGIGRPMRFRADSIVLIDPCEEGSLLTLSTGAHYHVSEAPEEVEALVEGASAR